MTISITLSSNERSRLGGGKHITLFGASGRKIDSSSSSSSLEVRPSCVYSRFHRIFGFSILSSGSCPGSVSGSFLFEGLVGVSISFCIAVFIIVCPSGPGMLTLAYIIPFFVGICHGWVLLA